MTRDDPIEEALARLTRMTFGCEPSAIEALAPGLGRRRFFRLRLAAKPDSHIPASAIARVEAEEDPALRAPGAVAEPPLEPLLGFLARQGIPVPTRYGSDPELGIDLLEDAGPLSLEDVAAGLDPGTRRSLYAEACDWIPRLQRLRASPDEVPAFGRQLDAPLFESKAQRVVEWALPWALGRPASTSETAVVREAFAFIAKVCARAPQRLSHRDYKAANLHVKPNAAPGERLVMIDIQGALLAPPEYDLVCLLRDSHVPLPEAEVREQLERLRPALPDLPDADSFERRFQLLTLSRVAKDYAHYVHAAGGDDLRYLPLLPTALRNLRSAAALASPWDPTLARLADLLSHLKSESSGTLQPTPQESPRP